MRFQKRDGDLLKAIYDNGGVLSRRQIKSMFWFDTTWRAMEKRLSKLEQSGYILWPDKEQRRNHPIPEPICWLGPKGIEYIAGEYGVIVKSPKSTNEYQLRKYRKNLKDLDINWLREPRWSILRHDLKVIDLKIAIMDAVSRLPNISMENWTSENVFRSDMDIVEYEIKNKEGNPQKVKKGICPDAYFEIVDEVRREKGQLHLKRYLVELDMATHPNRRFGKEKALPGIEYIRSPAYKARFGQNIGRWLVVTSGGEIRMRNLMQQTMNNTGDDAIWFYFTQLERLNDRNILTSPIWHRVGTELPISLLD